MIPRRKLVSALFAGVGGALAATIAARVTAQGAGTEPSPSPAGSAPPPLPLFAVELRTGPKWDHAKPAQEQAYFREHSANLKRLRDQGHILIGARYSDKGLLLMAGATASAVKEMMDADPAIQNQVFAYDLHDFRVFYPGCVGAQARRT